MIKSKKKKNIAIENDSEIPSDFLKIENLTVEYVSDRTVVHAVNDVSLSLKKGETLGLVGETGAGKTTIAKSILQILPDKQGMIKSGKIWVDGVCVNHLSEREMRKIRGKKISMVFQDPMTALNPTKSVGSQIAEAISLHENCTKKEAAARAGNMMEMVGIPASRYSEYPHQFSGGMKRRIVIAIALACEPELLLADEPTTALDVTIQAQVLDMIAKLKDELQTSMILITHDLGIVAGTCDNVAVIYAGEVIEYGSTFDIYDHPTHPYTIGLFGSLPNITGKEKRLHPIDGMMPDPTNLPEGCKFHPRCPWATEACRTICPQETTLTDTHFVKCHRVGEINNG